jgi:hypothetical protein
MKWLVAALLLAGCLPRGAGEQELRTRVPGTWVGAAPDGTRLTMKLEADGSGEVNGLRGSWQIKVGRILLSDGEHLIPCDLDGDELTCHTPEGDLVMTRGTAGEKVAAASAEPAAPSSPEKTTGGQPFIAPANGPIRGCSFTPPAGWTHNVVQASGHKVHMVQSPEVENATIMIGRVELSAFGDHPPAANTAFLDAEIARYTSGKHEVVLRSEDIDLRGQVAAWGLVKYDSDEYSVAVVGGQDAIFVIVGRYPADRAKELRPLVQDMLRSFRASP